ncbi:MAG: FAD-binding protein [Candidatus Aminicenantes bacterium]|nr:FAD-binding protein [Candidatus Aminicenantes bacterium]
MKTDFVGFEGLRVPVHSLDTLVIGSGAAGLNAASLLHGLGRTGVAVVTEKLGGGTSANTGSDKQTYYKAALAGGRADSPLDMAGDLFGGGAMHGDIALCEAMGSLPAFFRLVGLGVPFPHDLHGAYVGYKTDHDPRQRATSAGPLTSQLMVAALLGDIRRRRIRIFDRHQVVALLTAGSGDGKKAVGAAALDLGRRAGQSRGLVLFNAANVILATGGPAGIYRHSVYPHSQTGSHGLAFEAGAAAQNLTEWQYGLASTKFRWNLSGTYQQVIPRYFSTDSRGRDEREFLNEVFPDMARLATAIFLKGYEWPFDVRKIAGYGSSLIDLLVYRETALRKRRVFLDFRRNPSGGGRLRDFEFSLLAPDAYTYLVRSGALLPRPIDRLRRMNPPAVELYLSQGIDLAGEPLEIAVCAQHNNGGFRGDIWWESNLRRLFPIGEANGSHGVCRPGGSALNAGQVGSFRAALRIARKYGRKPPRTDVFFEEVESQVRSLWEKAGRWIGPPPPRGAIAPARAVAEIRNRMSTRAAHIRDPQTIAAEVRKAWRLHGHLRSNLRVKDAAGLAEAFKALDLALTHALYLEAMAEYLARGGRSRGSALVLDPKGEPPCPELGDDWKFALAREDDFAHRNILEIGLDEDGRVRKDWVSPRPIPEPEGWFEAIWKDFREGRSFGPDEEDP